MQASGETERYKFNVTLPNDKVRSFHITVHPDWAPKGAARFKEMVDSGFYKNIKFFRVIKGFMAQFGIHGNPDKAAEWREKVIEDDPDVG